MATKVLVDAGLKVAVIEAGPYFDPANPDQQTQFKWPYESPCRVAGTKRFFGEYDIAYSEWDEDGNLLTYSNQCFFSIFKIYKDRL